MARVGKLTKLKSAIKRWPSIAKLARTASSISVAATSNADETMSKECHTVYVGKSRRRYLVGSDIIGHPLFQELVEKSSVGGSDDGVVVVLCEVVLFEHLLWMLQSSATQLGPTAELVEFYTY